MAVAEFKIASSSVQGTLLFQQQGSDVIADASFTQLPPGKHGFHIHKAGDLRGEGCKGACEHFHYGEPSDHGDEPNSRGSRHTGDLGNISLGPGGEPFSKMYLLKNLPIEELYGRTAIVHEDEDDLGKGEHEDSKTTGHSGKRIACAIIGRIACEGQQGGDLGLYADNPKGRKPRVPGTGYGTRKKALHTIHLLKGKPTGLKRQIATTMYYRAKHHARQTKNMREAMKVYRGYLKTLKNK
jgi:Cu-Zn family superoxide dismutase